MTEAKAYTIETRLQKNLTFVRERIRKYYNLKRSKGLTLKEGNRVYFFRGNIKGKRNIKSKRPYDKLDFRKLKAYLIKREVHLDVY